MSFSLLAPISSSAVVVSAPDQCFQDDTISVFADEYRLITSTENTTLANADLEPIDCYVYETAEDDVYSRVVSHVIEYEPVP